MRRRVLVLIVCALACRKSERVELRRDDPVAPVAPPQTDEFESFIRAATALAKKDGAEPTLLWARASCADANGRVATTCSGKTWSGTPVFGVTGGLIASSGFYSAEFARALPGGKNDRFGVTQVGLDRRTQIFAGDPVGARRRVTCALRDVVARAAAKGFSTSVPFKIIVETGDDTLATEWRFVRDDESVSVDDDCGAPSPPTDTRSFMEPLDKDCYREVRCRSFTVACPAKYEARNHDPAWTAKLRADAGASWCCYSSTVCEMPEK